MRSGECNLATASAKSVLEGGDITVTQQLFDAAEFQLECLSISKAKVDCAFHVATRKVTRVKLFVAERLVDNTGGSGSVVVKLTHVPLAAFLTSP